MGLINLSLDLIVLLTMLIVQYKINPHRLKHALMLLFRQLILLGVEIYW